MHWLHFFSISITLILKPSPRLLRFINAQWTILLVLLCPYKRVTNPDTQVSFTLIPIIDCPHPIYQIEHLEIDEKNQVTVDIKIYLWKGRNDLVIDRYRGSCLIDSSPTTHTGSARFSFRVNHPPWQKTGRHQRVMMHLIFVIHGITLVLQATSAG